MDPMKPYAKNGNHFQKIISVVSNTCTFISEDDSEKYQFPELTLVSCTETDVKAQQDTYNCGVYVLYYIYNIINKRAFFINFQPSEFRLTMQNYLLQNSKNMTNMCMYCGVFENEHIKTKWVDCTYCCRWVGIQCIPLTYRLDDYVTGSFKCLLCLDYV